MSDFELITVSSHRPTQEYYCYDEFFGSCRKYGFEPTVLGGDGSYKGLISKPKILLKHIQSGAVKAPNIMFADCWDVLFLRSPQEAFDLHCRPEVIFNAEKALFPHVDNYPKIYGPYPFLNAGFFIGPTEMVLTLLERMNLHEILDDYQKPDGTWWHENDQKYYLEAHRDRLVPIALDHEARLCQTLHETTIFEVEVSNDGVVRNIQTGYRPVAIHGNGNGKESAPMKEALRIWRQQNP